MMCGAMRVLLLLIGANMLTELRLRRRDWGEEHWEKKEHWVVDVGALGWK